nr:LysR substrate-binding domain-containing protein [Pseudonocardia sp. C8]
MEYFRVLAEDGNFSRAAERLRISQPALSQQIQRLEAEVGAPLVDRTSRPVALTEVGRRLLEQTAELLDQVRSIERLATAAGRGETGSLRIGVIPLALLGPVPGCLRAFRGTHPDVLVSLHRSDSAPLLDLLGSGRLDAGFLTAAPHPSTGLHGTDLWETELELAVPDDHRLAGTGPVALRELAREHLVLFPREAAPENYDLVITACAAAGFSPRLVTTTGGYADQIGYVAAGVGVALVPREVGVVHAEGVARLPLAEPLGLTMRVVWNPGRPNPALRAFLAVLGRAAGTGT